MVSIASKAREIADAVVTHLVDGGFIVTGLPDERVAIRANAFDFVYAIVHAELVQCLPSESPGLESLARTVNDEIRASAPKVKTFGKPIRYRIPVDKLSEAQAFLKGLGAERVEEHVAD